MNQSDHSSTSFTSKTFKKISIACAAILISIPAFAAPGDIVSFSQSGNVSATFLANEGAFGHALEMASTLGSVTAPIFTMNATGFPDTPIGTTVDLGAYRASSELEFRLTNVYNFSFQGIPFQLFTGPGSRNTDGGIYADVTFVNPTEIVVGFNDLGAYPSRETFNNLIFRLDLVPSSLTPDPATNVPEPGILALFGLGLLGLLKLRWKESV